MKLLQRFSLTHGFIALLAVLVTLIVMIGEAHHFFWNEIRESQHHQLGAFSLAAQEAFFAREDLATLNFMRLISKEESVAISAFTDEHGNNLLVLPTGLKTIDLSKGDQTLPDGRRISVLSKTVEPGGRKIGTVSIAYNTDVLEGRVRAQVNRWVELGAVAGVSALVVAVVVSFLLSGTLVRPLKRIREGTRKVRSGKLDQLVEVNRSDEIGDLARDFNSMVVQLKELDEMKRDFVAGVTHDFGVPLNAIKNGLELLQERKWGPLTDKQADYLLMVSNNTISLTAFIENLLTTSRLQAAKAEPYFEPVDISALAKGIVELYQPQAQKLGLELGLLTEGSPLSWITDATMFRQILANLVSNAMKFTLKGRVDVSIKEDLENLILKVTDTGIGIDPQYHVLIFDRFFRIRQPKDFPTRQGSGLGLSIVKGLTETMGGSISVESSPGKGSTFTVKLHQSTQTPGGSLA